MPKNPIFTALMRALRILFSFFVFSAFLLQLVGPYILLQVKRNAHFEKQIVRAETSHAHTFALADLLESPHFRWERMSREFIHEGRLYDVVDIQTKNGRVEILAVEDGTEEELLEDFEDENDDDRDAEICFGTDIFSPCENPSLYFYTPQYTLGCVPCKNAISSPHVFFDPFPPEVTV